MHSLTSQRKLLLISVSDQELNDTVHPVTSNTGHSPIPELHSAVLRGPAFISLTLIVLMITPEFSFRFVLRCLTSYIGYVLSFCEAKYAKPLLEVPYFYTT